MFYSIIQRKRDECFSRENYPIKSLLSYIESKGMIRDAHIEAIKTYLFLKIECGNKPLWRLFDCTSADSSSPWHSDSEIPIDRLGYVRKNGIDTKFFWDGTITSNNTPFRLKIRNIYGNETYIAY